MTIAVACNIPDGLIFGTDSAVTIQNPAGQSRIYADGEKLFTLADRPVAIATWGLASLDRRTIGSYIQEFETTNPKAVRAPAIADVVRELWLFLNGKYRDAMTAAGATLLPDDRAILGLMVGGFSEGAYLSELWEAYAQQDEEAKAVGRIAAPGVFTAAWRGMIDAIRRLVTGIDPTYAEWIYKAVQNHHKFPDDPALLSAISDQLDKWQYRFAFSGMPLQEGVDYVRFLLDIMINHSRFVDGAFGCGGPVRIVVVKPDKVVPVTSHPFRISH